MQQQEASWAAQHLSSWILTAHLSSTKASPGALCLPTCSQKSKLKQVLSSIPSRFFPQKQAKAIHNVLSSFPFISSFHMGYLPPFSSAWVVIQTETQHAGSHLHPWWMLTGFRNITLLIEALPKLQQHSELQTSQTNSSRLLPKTMHVK